MDPILLQLGFSLEYPKEGYSCPLNDTGTMRWHRRGSEFHLECSRYKRHYRLPTPEELKMLVDQEKNLN